MPVARINDCDLYYEMHGAGAPLLLIAGLGCATWLWARNLAALAARFQVIAFDNRGAGRSEKPDMPYSAGLLADDAAGLLQHLGVSRAHVLGVSMGGFIAQELALLYPERVDRLVLGCTMSRGDVVTREFEEAMTRVDGLTPEQVFRRAMELTAAPGYWGARPAEFEQVLAVRTEWNPPRHAYQRQWHLGLHFNATYRVHRIQAPTLVCAGDADRVVPPAETARLAERIPGARLRIYSPAGHWFFWEQAERFNRDVIRFLGEGA